MAFALLMTPAAQLNGNGIDSYESELRWARRLIGDGQFDKARGVLESLIESDSALDGRANLYLSVALIRAERVETNPFPSYPRLRSAIWHAEQALSRLRTHDDYDNIALETDRSTARFVLAVARTRLGYTRRAKDDFGLVLRHMATDDIQQHKDEAQRVEDWLAILAEGQKAWRLSLTAGIFYDTNVQRASGGSS